MANQITEAKKLLKRICVKYKKNDKYIMQGVKGEEKHALNVLRWIKKLNPKASIALQLAALFHDVDRIITSKMGGGFKGDRTSKAYKIHKKMHAKRSANFVIPILEKTIKNKKIIRETRFLITHHDDTGIRIKKINNKDLDHLVSADSFAFFTSIAPKLYKAEGKERIKDKIRFMVDKIPESSRIILKKLRLKNKALNQLKNRIIKEYYKKH